MFGSLTILSMEDQQQLKKKISQDLLKKLIFIQNIRKTVQRELADGNYEDIKLAIK